ncbi:hypothetical protein HK102_002678 [Quaeritorhiza haematococci]|nr:hypothetical protein HK102_002678 [Quaeritorhiza haematococci]
MDALRDKIHDAEKAVRSEERIGERVERLLENSEEELGLAKTELAYANKMLLTRGLIGSYGYRVVRVEIDVDNDTYDLAARFLTVLASNRGWNVKYITRPKSLMEDDLEKVENDGENRDSNSTSRSV